MHKTKLRELNRRLESAERQGSALRRRLFGDHLEEDTLLITVSDLMTILLILFILLYQMRAAGVIPSSSGHAGKTVRSPTTGTDSSVPLARTVRSMPEPGQPETGSESLARLKRQAIQALGNDMGPDFYLRTEDRKLVIVLGERITFEIGKAEVRVSFYPTLLHLARFLVEKAGYRVVVSGHTDNTPIRSARFPSNWELSVARAVNVARFLIAEGVDPRRVSVEGYGEFRPLVENDSAAHRQINRRVEVALVQQ